MPKSLRGENLAVDTQEDVYSSVAGIDSVDTRGRGLRPDEETGIQALFSAFTAFAEEQNDTNSPTYPDNSDLQKPEQGDNL